MEKTTFNASKKIEAYAVYVNGKRLFDSVSFQAALDSANSYRKLSATLLVRYGFRKSQQKVTGVVSYSSANDWVMLLLLMATGR